MDQLEFGERPIDLMELQGLFEMAKSRIPKGTLVKAEVRVKISGKGWMSFISGASHPGLVHIVGPYFPREDEEVPCGTGGISG